jgi:hypothetical protein
MKRSTLNVLRGKLMFRSGSAAIKHIVTGALVAVIGVGVASARDISVKMTYSGTNAASTINLQQPDTNTSEDSFAGGGTLGSFTVHNIRAMNNNPSTSSSCSGANQLFFVEPAGGSVFRFQDGSLLELNLTQGSDCIDLSTGLANCTLTFQVIGGTGRFTHASGTLTMKETTAVVLFDALGNPVWFSGTGDFTGTISGVGPGTKKGTEEEQP